MSTYTKLLLVACLAALSNPSKVSANQPLRIITVGGAEMVAKHIKVRFTEPLLSEEQIPPGFALHHRFIEPYGVQAPAALAKAPSQALLEARRNVLRCAVLSYNWDITPDLAAQRIAKYSQVTFAEPWYVMHVQGQPNDPLYGQQEALHLIGTTEAWDITEGSESMVIAIVDNGVDQSHEDIKPNLHINTAEIPGNRIDDDGNGFVDDYNGYNLVWMEDGTDPGNTTNNGSNGHGTNVAGIVGAATNNGLGIAGVANKCRIFPIKTAPIGTGSILYGYEGMLYAAQNGFKVINCSWGSQSRAGYVKPYSVIDKSVIDYCLALGSMVVSSAGNHGNGIGGSGWLEFNYPAAYDGVLGVAECTTSEKVASTSGLGRNAGIVAPSTDAITTVPAGGYSSAGIQGTSFASPMVAGAAALVRVKWPSLTPAQVSAVLTTTSKKILSSNPSVAKALAGRLDLLAALQSDPSQMPGFRVSGKRIVVRGVTTNRFSNGDTLELYYTLTNELAASAPLTCMLRIMDPAGWQAVVINDTTSAPAVGSGQTIEVGPFTVVVSQYQDKPCLMDLTINSHTHSQREFVYIEPSATMTTLMNNELSYSIGDRGMFAFGSTLANNMEGNGTGAGWRTKYQKLAWTSGLLFCTSDGRALKAYDNAQDKSDFSAVKTFTVPDENIGILTDSLAGDRSIGVRIHERCSFPSANSLTSVIEIGIENRTASALQDVAAGYFFDWDIGPNGTDNRTRLAPEALPTSFKSMGEAQMFYRDSVPVVVVCAAVSSEPQIQGQAAGMMLFDYADDSDRLSDADVYTLLTSGTSVQTTMLGDACGVVGMRFPGALAPGETKHFKIVFGVGATQEEAANNVRQTIENPNSVASESNAEIALYPNPAATAITLGNLHNVRRVLVVDMLGNRVYDNDVLGSTEVVVDVRGLPSGRYCVVLQGPSSVTSEFLTIVR